MKNKILFLFIISIGACTKKLEYKYHIRNYGNVRDITDELKSLIRKNVERIDIEKGNYLLSDFIHLESKNNLILNANHSIISFYNPGYHNPGIFKIFNSNRIYIRNLTIDGNRSLNGKNLCSGLYILDSENIDVDSVNIIHSYGDGINIASTSRNSISRNIMISNFSIINSTRNGVSITFAENIDLVNGIIEDTNGERPQAGIDIEADHATDKISNIKIKNVSIKRNKGNGIAIPHVANPKFIEIENCTIDNNAIGLWSCGSNVSIRNTRIQNNTAYGICQITYPEYGITNDSLVVDKCTIVNHDVGIYYKGQKGQILDSHISKTKNQAIEVASIENNYTSILIKNNTITEAESTFAISTNASYIKVENNEIGQINGIGVATYQGHADIISNKFTDTGNSSIYIHCCTANIENNTFIDSRKEAIRLIESKISTNVDIIKNTFYYNFSKSNSPIIQDDVGIIGMFKDNIIISEGKEPMVQFKRTPRINLGNINKSSK